MAINELKCAITKINYDFLFELIANKYYLAIKKINPYLFLQSYKHYYKTKLYTVLDFAKYNYDYAAYKIVAELVIQKYPLRNVLLELATHSSDKMYFEFFKEVAVTHYNFYGQL